ncbi:MAG: TonB-dependent receptor [Thermodesulforhabdaceae bacterium]
MNTSMGRFVFMLIPIFFVLPSIVLATQGYKEEEMETVIVTATKTTKKLENVPAVVRVITSDEIKTLPAKTVGDLLKDLPGVYPSEPQGEGLVTPQSVTLQGIGFPGANLILLDGQKVNTPFTDYAYLTTIPVHAVDRIEIIRGPFSALYGSSAGGGIINIITKDGGSRSYVSPWGQAGNFGRYDAGVDAGIVWKGFSLGLFYDRKHTDNYYSYNDRGLDTRNRDYTHDRFHGKLTGTIGQNTFFSLSGGFIDADTGFGISNNLKLENHQEVSHPYVNFQSTTLFSSSFELKAQLDWLKVSHNYHGETLERVIPAPPPPRFIYKASLNKTTGDRYHADLQGNYKFSDNMILTLGSEVAYSDAEKGIYDLQTGQLLPVQGRAGTKADVDDIMTSVYAQYDWIFFEDFEAVLGGRFDHHDTYGSEFSPKASIIWNYMKKDGNIKLSVGKGFRAPSLNELYSPPWSIAPYVVYQGNPDLEAETTWSYQLSLEQYALDRKLHGRVTPYYTTGKDFITSVRRPDPLNPGGQIMRPENIDKVKIKGVDVELDYALTKGITVFSNYSYNETRNDKTDQILDGYPKHSASLGIRTNYQLNEEWLFFGSYSARYRGSYRSTSWSNPPVVEKVGDYWYHTSRIGVGWRDLIEFYVDLYNIFDERKKTDINTYIPEFNYLIGASIKYRF